MKNFKILIIPFFIFAIFLIIGFIIYQNKAIISEYLSNEPVVENKISLKAKEIHDYMREK